MKIKVIIDESSKKYQLPHNDEVLIGRDNNTCDIVINHPGLSRIHASVKVRKGKLFIKDLGSTNGTMINGERIAAQKSVEVQPNDQVALAPDYSVVLTKDSVANTHVAATLNTQNSIQDLLSYNDEVILGSSHFADIVLNDSSVSRKHARIYINNGNYFVEDLGSTNGTFVNGVRIRKKTQLSAFDEVLIGSSTYEVDEQPLPLDISDETMFPVEEDYQPNTWIDYSFGSLHGLPLFFYLFLQLIRFVAFGADPVIAWLVLNTIGLILSGFSLILGFWISNIIVIGINYLLIAVMLRQLGIEEMDFPESKNNDITFIPAQGNHNFWRKKRDIDLHSSQMGGRNILFALPDYNFRTINKRKHLIDAPRIDEDSLSRVKIFSGRSFIDQIDSGKVTTYDRSNLLKVKEWINYNDNIVVFMPKKSVRREPLLLKCDPYYLLDGLSETFSDNSPFVRKMRKAIASWEKDDDLW